MDENVAILVGQLGPQLLAVAAALGGTSLTLLFTGRREKERAMVEDRHRSEDLRVKAIERCAGLLQADRSFLQRRLHAASRAESLPVEDEPGTEAISLLKIYFLSETAADAAEYMENRTLATEELRQYALSAFMGRLERKAQPVFKQIADLPNKDESAAIVHRDAATKLLVDLNRVRDALIERLAALMSRQLQPLTKQRP